MRAIAELVPRKTLPGGLGGVRALVFISGIVETHLLEVRGRFV